MKGKYITYQIVLACLSRPPATKKDIYESLANTMNERRRVLQQWEASFFGSGKDIHGQLAETIAERRRLVRQWESVFFPEKKSSYLMQDKQAA